MSTNDASRTVRPIEPDGVEPVLWQDTIAAADHALEEATRIKRGVQHNLKLQAQVRALREELHKAHAERDHNRGMHARVVKRKRQLEDDNAAAIARLQQENERLLVRYRLYKLLAEHYTMTALRFGADRLTLHRERVLHHLLFQQRKGLAISTIGVDEITCLLL